MRLVIRPAGARALGAARDWGGGGVARVRAEADTRGIIALAA